MNRTETGQDLQLLEALRPTLEANTGVSSAGHPFLSASGFDLFKRRTPHLLGMGERVLRALDDAEDAGIGSAPARKVVGTIVRTAAITAPSDLWLLKYVIATLRQVGGLPSPGDPAKPAEQGCDIQADLSLLEARGYLTPGGRPIGTERARRVLEELAPPPPGVSAGVSTVWARLFRGQSLGPAERSALSEVTRGGPPLGRTLDQSDCEDRPDLGWTATLEEIELGWRILPVVLGLVQAGRASELAAGGAVSLDGSIDLVEVALAHLAAAGFVSPVQPGERRAVATRMGRRVFARGKGPFGIIEAYHPYMDRLGDLLRQGRTRVWVNRSANVAASQAANQVAFGKAHASLNRFIADTGFELRVFIEHAMGRGEAIRQRWRLSGDAPITYVGADLEAAAVAAATAEREAGNLPPDTLLLGDCDIGQPASLLDRLHSASVPTEGAVMMVGNGFHEVRGEDNDGMVEVFRAYHDAGIVLVFTEASALPTEDLVATAWNTYHAGFRYVHAKSGQGLRPADVSLARSPTSALPISWQACAERAGYVRLEAYCARSRTIYPTRPVDRPNPCISVTHFCVPGPLAETLEGPQMPGA